MIKTLMFPSFLKIGFKRIFLLIAVYFIGRILFLVWNWNFYEDVRRLDIAYAFIYGLRFDLSAILLTNLPVIILWMLPARWYDWPWVSRLEIGLFSVINVVCVGANVADAEFVKFIGKRSGFDILLIRQDLGQHGLSVLSTYWYFTVAVALLMLGVAWAAPRFRDLREPGSIWASLIWRLVAIGLIVTGARGGYQFKPLHPMHAYFSTRHELGLLVLNTPFNVIRSRPTNGIERQKFFSDDREPVSHLLSITELTRPPLALARKFNVVVILVESLGSEYVGAANDFPGYTPFLDGLANEPGAFFFKYNLANSRRSIEGLPAVVCGIPAIMSEPVITSDFSNNRFECLPRVLGRQGYSSYFLHGAHNGSMHFDTFSRIAGFENFVGLNEYPKNNPEDLDQYWGVLDEPMLQYAAKVMDEAPKPAVVTVFTLSSHHPYYIPPKYKDKFPKGTLEIHESIGYADHAISEFFKTARSKPWFENTIFVITGDHTQKFYHKEYGNLLGYYRVPLFIYAPGLAASKIPFDPDRITQQIDILPSLFDLLGLKLQDRLLVGQSVFDLANEGRAYCFNSPEYWYVDKNLFMNMSRGGDFHNVGKRISGFSFEPMAPAGDEFEAAARTLRSVVHYLNEGLIRNSLYSWKRSQ